MPWTGRLSKRSLRDEASLVVARRYNFDRLIKADDFEVRARFQGRVNSRTIRCSAGTTPMTGQMVSGGMSQSCRAFIH